MRLFPGKVPFISGEIINKLIGDEDIEVAPESKDEAVIDVEAILKEYIRIERELFERAKDIIEIRNLDSSNFFRIKKQLFAEKGIPADETVIDYLIDQIIEMFMHSVHIEEVYASDNDLRGKMGVILKRFMNLDAEIDREVRHQIKNLEEGTSDWEIEYQKMLGKLRQTKNLD